ncbi:MAG TPA: NAD-dependent epimerase/dehydratase family protein, partial [Terriglobales bacterium]
NVVQAARRVGVKRFVQMSAIGARPNGVSEYQTSKYRAEEAVRNSGIPFIILRPSIIFGPGDGFVSQMVQVMKSAPLIRPVVGSGRSRFRPIYVGDVARCFVDALTNDTALGRTIHLVGAEELTFDELLTRIANCIGVRKRALHIPLPLMMVAAHVLSLLSTQPLVTPDQLAMLEEGSTADPKEMLQVFKFEPISFTEGLRTY